ncbi:hypothetical protein Asi03nite_01970 [Actinoplanes siamensis]|uniref:Uncharacterized protein n=1 Tax=Actinoplanes siamensis TaxID=1223317 RepID=A0A919K9U6_9ACTN|nr:hypothetical protein Asi03nite_01970 [Actinoplanes siamensis]
MPLLEHRQAPCHDFGCGAGDGLTVEACDQFPLPVAVDPHRFVSQRDEPIKGLRWHRSPGDVPQQDDPIHADLIDLVQDSLERR